MQELSSILIAVQLYKWWLNKEPLSTGERNKMFNRENLTKKDWLAKAEEFKQTAIESRTKEQVSWAR